MAPILLVFSGVYIAGLIVFIIIVILFLFIYFLLKRKGTNIELNKYLEETETYYEENEDYTLEEDFNSLDKEQQDEIILKLKEADF